MHLNFFKCNHIHDAIELPIYVIHIHAGLKGQPPFILVYQNSNKVFPRNKKIKH